MSKPYRDPKQMKKQSNIYKTGKLTRSTRFSSPKINKKWLILIGCILASLLFAVILGNILGDVARDSQNNINDAGSSSSLGVPSVDKASPKTDLHAYFADMSSADPELTLSNQTSTARDSGNALFFVMQKDDGTLIYSSSKAEELGYAQADNLTLSRLGNHLDYYNDYAVGLFRSELSATLSLEKRLNVQTNESLLLAEMASVALDQIIIEFSGELHKYNAIYFETYLLNIKLACEGTPIGIKLPYSFFVNAANSGVIAELFEIVDFCAIDLESKNADEIRAEIEPLSYVIERYKTLIMIDSKDESVLESRIDALTKSGVKNYIVK